MSDIVERLRLVGDDQAKIFCGPILYLEAADEIVRLTRELAEATSFGPFKAGDYVRKKSGAFWEGVVVKGYSTKQTPSGVCVQLFGWDDGPVQIYPAGALEFCPKGESRLSVARNTALDEAAKVADDEDARFTWAGQDRNVRMLQQCASEIATAIRALKDKP